jgi:class 3 adenylate cyclase
MVDLPSGVITMLFSDIEGSTLTLSRLGSRWGEALSAQRAILRSVFAGHEGIEMGTEGDSFFVVFTSARQAVLAAVEGQRRLQQHEWPDSVPIRVRMGLHTGEPQRHEDGYIGLDLHRAARIAGTSGGGQIVVSEATDCSLERWVSRCVCETSDGTA